MYEPACGGPATTGNSGAAGPSSVPSVAENMHSSPYDLRRKSPTHYSNPDPALCLHSSSSSSLNSASNITNIRETSSQPLNLTPLLATTATNVTSSSGSTASCNTTSTVSSSSNNDNDVMLPARKRSRRSYSSYPESAYIYFRV